MTVLILITLSFIAFSIHKKINREKHIAKQIYNIPKFCFYNPGTGSIFNNNDLEKNKATLIINFHPECEHCQYEADIISERINEFRPFQVLFITYASAEQIRKFAQDYRLIGFANIIFLEDRELIFNDVFGESIVPESYIYDKNGKLVKKFRGEVKVEALLKYLQTKDGNNIYPTH